MKINQYPQGLHHVELWLPPSDDENTTFRPWNWLLPQLGFTLSAQWPSGQSWSIGATYLSLTISPRTSAPTHDRRQPGVNHLAFHGGPPKRVDELMNQAPHHGWARLYYDRYPHAGGPDHYAGWLENTAGYKVEIVATSAR